jgi:hypothetical protein
MRIRDVLLFLFLGIHLLMGNPAFGVATITNSSESFSTAYAFVPGYYGSNPGDCRDPYHYFSNSAQVGVSWDKVVLENDYVRVDVLPYLGGRVLRFVNKITGSNQFYENPAGFMHNGWGRLGWSCTGGTEVMMPLDEHHGPFYLPWDDKPPPVDTEGNWLTEDLGDRVRLTMVLDEDTSELYGGSNNRFKLTVQIELADDEAAYTVHFTLQNENGSSRRLEFWSNSMCSPGPGNMDYGGAGTNLNQHTIYPKQVTQVYDHNDNGGSGPGGSSAWETLNWPIHAGQDISLFQTFLSQNYGYMGTFVANGVDVTFGGIYNLDADEGIVKTFPAQIYPGVDSGLKFWHWGDSGMAGWTVGTSTYMEMMSGPVTVFQHPADCSFSPHPTGQTDDIWVAGGGSIDWTDTYISPYGIDDVVYAESNCVMNFEAPSVAVCGLPLSLEIGVYPTSAQADASVSVSIGGSTFWSQTGLQVGPGSSPYDPYYQTLSPIVDGVPSGSQTITLTFTFDDSSTVSYSQPIFVSGVCESTPTPTSQATDTPTPVPTSTPTDAPTDTPTEVPTNTATEQPTSTPTDVATNTPTEPPASPTPTSETGLHRNLWRMY